MNNLDKLPAEILCQIAPDTDENFALAYPRIDNEIDSETQREWFIEERKIVRADNVDAIKTLACPYDTLIYNAFNKEVLNRDLVQTYLVNLRSVALYNTGTADFSGHTKLQTLYAFRSTVAIKGCDKMEAAVTLGSSSNPEPGSLTRGLIPLFLANGVVKVSPHLFLSPKFPKLEEMFDHQVHDMTGCDGLFYVNDEVENDDNYNGDYNFDGDEDRTYSEESQQLRRALIEKPELKVAITGDDGPFNLSHYISRKTVEIHAYVYKGRGTRLYFNAKRYPHLHTIAFHDQTRKGNMTLCMDTVSLPRTVHTLEINGSYMQGDVGEVCEHVKNVRLNCGNYEYGQFNLNSNIIECLYIRSPHSLKFRINNAPMLNTLYLEDFSRCWDNKIYISCELPSLTRCTIHGRNAVRQVLSSFSKAINLKELFVGVGDDDEDDEYENDEEYGKEDDDEEEYEEYDSYEEEYEDYDLKSKILIIDLSHLTLLETLHVTASKIKKRVKFMLPESFNNLSEIYLRGDVYDSKNINDLLTRCPNAVHVDVESRGSCNGVVIPSESLITFNYKIHGSGRVQEDVIDISRSKHIQVAKINIAKISTVRVYKNNPIVFC